MRYVLKQKLFALGDDFHIRDENGRDVYFVDGKAFSIGNELSFRDMAGHELAFIRQRLLAWGPTYEITRDGKLVAEVRKKLFALFHHRFTIDACSSWRAPSSSTWPVIPTTSDSDGCRRAVRDGQLSTLSSSSSSLSASAICSHDSAHVSHTSAHCVRYSSSGCWRQASAHARHTSAHARHVLV